MFRVDVPEAARTHHAVDAGASVLEAARTMDGNARSPLVVRDAGRPVGLLTEDDIINKVLAPGFDPRSMRVADVMHRGRLARDGHTLLVEDEARATALVHYSEPLEDGELGMPSESEFPAGLCEECETDQDHLVEFEGFLVCEDCLPGRRPGPEFA